jgi:hypothetical protein
VAGCAMSRGFPSNQRVARETSRSLRETALAPMTSYVGAGRQQNRWGTKTLPTLPKGIAWLFPGLTLCLTLLPGHGIKSSRFLLNVLAAALGAFRVYFVFLEGEN